MKRGRPRQTIQDKKICRKCNLELSIDKFSYQPSKKHFRASCKDCLRIQQLDSINYHYHHCKCEAKRRDLSFDLTLEEFSSFKNKFCYYCNIELDRIRLDRFDNKIGYTISNCVACCWQCNKMKLTFSGNQFISICKKITENHQT